MISSLLCCWEQATHRHPPPLSSSSTHEMVSTPQPHLHFLWPPPPLSSSPSPNKLLSSVLSLSSSAPTTIPNPRPRPRKPSTLSLAAPRAHSQPLTLSDQTLDETSDLQLQASTANVPLLDQQPFRRIFVQEPPWTVPSILLRGLNLRSKERPGLGLGSGSDSDGVCERRRYNLLRRRQIRAETEAWQTMVEEYRELEREMCEKKLAPNLPHVKALFLGWFEPLRDAIAKDQKLHRSKKQKSAFAPNIDLLSPEKMAVIVMHKMMGLVMVGNEDGCVSVVQAALSIGTAIEQEVRIHSYLEKTKSPQRKRDVPCSQDSLTKEKELVRKRVKSLIKRKRLVEVQKLLRNEEFAPWGSDTQAKLGSRLIELLTETAYVQHPVDQAADCPPDIQPAFRHTFRTSARNSVPKMARKHGVIECNPAILKGLDQSARHMVIPYVPMLIPPRKWKGYNKGGYLFLPSYVMRTHGSKRQEDAIRSVSWKNLSKVFEALDTLGGTKWRINKRVLSVVESIWDKGGNVAGLIDRSDVPIPEKPLSEDMSEIQKWRWSVKKAKKTNQERHSQRCDIEIKLSVARRMKDEEGFYYPHNLDFRGRAYPMHPHLNHLSSDLCRGVLEFAEGRPLGVSGLHWLKIHLATVYGGSVDKLPHEGRLAFVEEHLHDIFDSAENPVTGNRWWIKAEDPFQCLAACMNLSEALKSSSPCTVISHLPIHQDGSCNGLQHYAALGRDSFEAAAVNLVAGEMPADVYSEIAARVQNIIERDSRKDPTDDQNALLANILINQVDRKLVKQTVMTSVYGVTYIGAREQIKRRLEEKGQITDDRLLFSASCYAAKVTLTALGELFEAARGIMGWLGDCAKVIASEDKPVQWNTPLGLPVVQPYCKNQRHLIKTSLQVLALRRDGKSIDGRKQRSAFPPNFVHSLDGSHMMMTAVACRDAGLHFAGVHDSFWTHACDVDRMNCILREKFVELYNAPILEELLGSFRATYPTLKFPPLPDRGDFNMEAVIDSTYFFN